MTKFYLYAISATFFCISSTFAIKCPDLANWDGKSGIDDWQFGYNKAPDNTQGWDFYNAWIYDKEAPDAEGGKTAKCHYSVKEGKKQTRIQFYRGDINSETYQFETPQKYNEKNKGYHCKGTIEQCAIIPKTTGQQKGK